MFPSFSVFGRTIPMYGVMLVTGVFVANLLVWFLRARKDEDFSFNDLIIIEAYAFLGIIIGAKGLYLFVSRDSIDWSRIFEPEYLNYIMSGGLVFYGGLIGAAFFIWFAGKLHHIDSVGYARKIAFAVPIAHAFGRVGCFFAGCCYGVHYEGPMAVVFPPNPLGSNVPAGEPLFPVQLFEAFFLFIIGIVIYIIEKKTSTDRTIEIYMILYGILRFSDEYLRGDSVRGFFGPFSTSQWISLGLVILGVVGIVVNKMKRMSVKN